MARRAELIAFVSIAVGGVLTGTSLAMADGTETLGQPSVAIEQGNGIAVAGTGLFDQPGTITVDVPGDATVKQVLLYVESGHHTSGGTPADDTFSVGGNELTCATIGGPAFFYGDVESTSYRCDITGLGLVGPGTSSFTIEGLNPSDINDGAGVLVIYQTPGQVGSVQVVDGNDIAFVDFPDDRGVTVPQTFTFTPSLEDRVADLGLMVGSIANYQKPDFTPRPSTLRITVDGVVTEIEDPFAADPEGPQFDAGKFDVNIPAGVSSLTVEMVSRYGRDGLPASLVWVNAALAMAPAKVQVEPVIQPPVTPTAPANPPTTVGGPSDNPPTTIIIEDFTTTPTIVIESTTTLPVTGAGTDFGIVIGLSAMTAGAALYVGSRKRQTAAAAC